MNIYKLYPPFLYVTEESDFPNQWEVFCLKLLKLELRTDDIERRRPPENGIDLYYEKMKKAYQCKSNLENSEVNLTNISRSLKNALTIKDSLGWDTYIICSNKNLTGDQVNKIKSIYKNVEVKGENYWIGLCEKYPQAVRNNFRILIDLNKPIHNYKKDIIFNPIFQDIRDKLNSDSETYINYCCEKHNKIYRIPVSLKLSIYEFMFILRNIMDINNVYKKTNGDAITHEILVVNDKEFYYDPDDSRTLEEIGIKNEDLVFYIINVEIKELKFNQSELQCIYNENYMNKNEIERDILENFDRKILIVNKRIDNYVG